MAAQMLTVAPLTVLGDFTVALENLVPDGTGYMKTKLFINMAILWERHTANGYTVLTSLRALTTWST
jgi:hypothetical protein